MTGANPQPEVASMLGYADAVIETPTDVFGPRPVTLIGINFNPRKRNIDIPAVEPA